MERRNSRRRKEIAEIEEGDKKKGEKEQPIKYFRGSEVGVDRNLSEIIPIENKEEGGGRERKHFRAAESFSSGEENAFCSVNRTLTGYNASASIVNAERKCRSTCIELALPLIKTLMVLAAYQLKSMHSRPLY